MIAEVAIIARDSPPRKLLIGSTTVRLVRPAPLQSLANLRTPATVVVFENDRVLGQVAVAQATKRDLKLAKNLHAILPADVTIYQVDADGTIRRRDSSQVNYLSIEDNVVP